MLFLQGGIEAKLAAKEAELGDRVKVFEELATKDAELEARVKAFEEQLASKDIELVNKTEELGRATLELDAARALVVSERGAAELRVQALEAESGQKVRALEAESEERGQKVRALEAEVAWLKQGRGVGAAGGGVQSPGDNQVPPGNEEQAGEEVDSPRDEQPRENEELVSEEEGGQPVESEEPEVPVRGTTMQLSRWIVRYTGTAHLKCRSLLSLDGVECADECISMKEQGVYTVFVHLKKKARARAVKALLSRVVEITEFNLLELGKKKGRGHHYMKVIQARLATDPVSLHINITRPSEGRQSTRFSAERGARDYGRKLL